MFHIGFMVSWKWCERSRLF